MKRLVASLITVFMLLVSAYAAADVWRWVDANGNTHYVDSNRPIWTWSDDGGKAYYSDTPEHEDAIRVQLFWHSSGSLDDVEDEQSSAAPVPAGGDAYPGETAEHRAQREAAVAHNCKRANEILESYENAPKLYRTDAEGQRRILSAEEYEREVAEARRKTAFLCSQ